MKKQIKSGTPPLRTAWQHLPLLLLMAFLWANCTKDPTPDPPLIEEDKLPPATQEGKNTFGCLINGKAWKPKSGGLLQPGLRGSYDEITGQLFVIANNYSTSNSECIAIGTKPIGLFSPDSLPFPDSTAYFFNSISSCGSAILEYENGQGHIKVSKIDRENGILSGTFEFAIVDPICFDTFRITKGRFDTKYKY
jgi:hypothetical protein